MKKALYLILGVIVAIFGLWLLIIWWPLFVDFLKGVLGPVVILIGVIIFIIGWMTPAKEETFEEPLLEPEAKPEEEEKKE